MLREKLRFYDLRITELANYFDLSRPTMYKFIDLYDSGNIKDINNKYLIELFDYIEHEEMIDKNNIVSFILDNLMEIKSPEKASTNKKIEKIKKYIIEFPNSEKTQFMVKAVEKDEYDLLIHFCTELRSIVKKDKLSDEEKKKIDLYNEILKVYSIEKKGE